MGFGRRVRRGVQAMVAPAFFLGLTGYFGWNATQGERGLQSYALRQVQLAEAKAELHRVEAQRDAVERRVMALRTQRLDPDMLDERVRAMLGQTDPADVVVLFNGPRKLF